LQQGGLSEREDPAIPESLVEAQLAQDPELAHQQQRLTQVRQRNARFQEVVSRKDHPALREALQEAQALEKSLEAQRSALRPVVIARLREQRGMEGTDALRERKDRVAILAKQEEILREEVERNSGEVKQIGTSSFELEDMRDEIGQIDKVAKRLSDEMYALHVELQSPGRVSMLQGAEPPRAPDLSRKSRFASLAALGAFAAVCLLIGGYEARIRRIHSVQDVSQGLSIPVLGTLPRVPTWARAGLPHKHSNRGHWSSMFAESIDATRTMLIRGARPDGPRVIMVASSMAREGKTTLACQLAGSLARAGRKTVLVDCDLRRPHGHKVFGVPLKPGFSEFLRGKSSLEGILRTPHAGGPSVISAGEFGADLAPLLARDDLGEIFKRLKAQFEFVIVDSAPTLPVADSLLVGQHVDGVIISIRRYFSRYANVAAACDRYHMLGIPILGAVAIGLESGAYHYSYGGTYGHAYNRICHS
jgi:capsular exopolysaccharide synthesis family protein